MIGRLAGRRCARIQWAGWLSPIVLSFLPCEAALSAPYVPANDAQVLAQLPPGSVHTSSAVLERARTRADVALPLAQFYIARARASGDLRYLGYAEGMLAPWLSGASARSVALVNLEEKFQEGFAFAGFPDQIRHFLTNARHVGAALAQRIHVDLWARLAQGPPAPVLLRPVDGRLGG